MILALAKKTDLDSIIDLINNMKDPFPLPDSLFRSIKIDANEEREPRSGQHRSRKS
jgi:hypothetical protein